MEAFAVSKFNRISLKKIQKVVLLVRKMSYIRALDSLLFLPQKSSKILRNVLKSAGANLSQKGSTLGQENWVIKSIVILRGSYYKRINPRARGHADRICKPTTHVKVIVSEKN